MYHMGWLVLPWWSVVFNYLKENIYSSSQTLSKNIIIIIIIIIIIKIIFLLLGYVIIITSLQTT